MVVALVVTIYQILESNQVLILHKTVHVIKENITIRYMIKQTKDFLLQNTKEICLKYMTVI